MQAIHVRRVSMLVLAGFVVGCGAQPAPGPAGSNETEAVVQELRVPDTLFGKGVPGGAYFNGTLFLTYTGTDSRINVMRRIDDGSFLKQTLPNLSGHGSQLVVFDGWLYMAWIGLQGNLFTLKTADGFNWEPGAVEAPSERGSTDPGLVVYQGVMTAFYPDVFTPNRIIQMNFDPGQSRWLVANTFFDATTNASPSAAVMGNDLLLSWVGRNDGRVFTRKFVPSTGWSAPSVLQAFYRSHVIPVETDPPSVLLLGSTAVGMIDPNVINLELSFDGFAFTYLGRLTDTTGQRPHGLRATGSFVELAYRGTNDGLYYVTSSLPPP